MADIDKEQKKTSKRFTYEELVSAIRQTGLKDGDTVVTFCSLFNLGRPILEGREYERFYLDAIFEVIGDNGLLVMPALSYTFCKHELYDPKSTLSDVNVLSNYCIQHGAGVRSLDPNFSYVFVTKADLYKSEPTQITKDIRKFKFSNVSFDYSEEHALPRLLIERNCRYLNLSDLPYLTLVHNVEQLIKSPTRYYKTFKGSIQTPEKLLEDVTIFYFCRYYFHNTEIEFEKLDRYFQYIEAHQEHDVQFKRVPLGKATILGASLKGFLDCVTECLIKDPYLVCFGPPLTEEQLASVHDPDAVTEADIVREYYPVVDLSK